MISISESTVMSGVQWKNIANITAQNKKFLQKFKKILIFNPKFSLFVLLY